MNFKIIKKEQMDKLYPNHYDDSVLKSYALMDWQLNTAFQYYYSCYHYLLDIYLKKLLNLEELNNQIKKMQAGTIFDNLYHDISSFDLDYLFVRNNIFLDRLTSEEFKEFKKLYDTKDMNVLLEFVKNTYKKLIIFDINRDTNSTVNYEPIGGLITSNNALVLGLLGKNSNELQELIKEKEKEYTKILNIPVIIFVYNENDELTEKIKIVENLNLENENKQKDILKRYSKFLPLGSIVTLKRSWKKLMIMGYSPIDMDRKDKIYDYLGCFYPEGIINSQVNILFNHENIKAIHCIGLVDDEEQAFMADIKNLIGTDAQKEEILEIVKEMGNGKSFMEN